MSVCPDCGQSLCDGLCVDSSRSHYARAEQYCRDAEKCFEIVRETLGPLRQLELFMQLTQLHIGLAQLDKGSR